MAFRCDRCGKGRLIGRHVRHKPGVAGGQWLKRAPRKRKVSLPNLHSFKGFFRGQKAQWKFCTKCLRLTKAEQPKTPAPKTA